MSTQQFTTQVERAELIISADNERQAGDPFKLPLFLRSGIETRLANAIARNAAAAPGKADVVGASGKVRDGLGLLNQLLHDGFNHIKAIKSYEISNPDRLATYTAYGWDGGKLGTLNDARIEDLARLAISTTPTIANPAWRYPEELLARITDALATVNAFQPVATGGTRSDLIGQRNLATDSLQIMTSRVRFYYCCASDFRDGTAELRKIGMQPRRDAITPPTSGDDGETLPTLRFTWEQVGASTVHVVIEMPEGLEGVTNVLLVEEDVEFSTAVSLQPGQSQLIVWEGVTIEGEIDEVVLRDADNEVLARGVRDESLEDPGP